MINPWFPKTELIIDQQNFQIVDLKGLVPEKFSHLPVVMRLLLENVSRCMQGVERDQAIHAIIEWLHRGSSEAEIEFQPRRILMHDTTSTPALVDMAAMRDVLREAGLNPALLNPKLPIDISVDHSLAVKTHANANADEVNLQLEIQANTERYQFLRWSAQAFQGVQIHPPGTGIMHTINLEQLATVVSIEKSNGQSLLIPDTLIGTDSHTPMINAMGVLGWGVGGLEAQTVMFGMPTMIRIPDVLGVYLSGALPVGSTATDLVLLLTQKIRNLKLGDFFVEFFGPGVSSLTLGQRAVVSNMAPEYGATTAFFPVDEQTLIYLQATGRSQAHCDLVREYCVHQGFWFDPLATPTFTKTLTLELNQLSPTVSGPKRPQDALPLFQMPDSLKALNLPHTTHKVLPEFPVALAAITSCTNTSDPGLLMAAGLLAQNANKKGLRPPFWVKTSLSPGSPAAQHYLQRAGVLNDLEALGFHIVGYGCATCIGNSGSLLPSITDVLSEGSAYPVAILSGNRNFPGRVHPELNLGFLMSPALVVALALAGRADFNLLTDPLGFDQYGEPVFLGDVWPTDEAIEAALSHGLDQNDFKLAFQKASLSPMWNALEYPTSVCFPWDETSTTLRRPPFAGLDQGSLLGSFKGYPLLVVGDDVTTDHISPASAIPTDSFVADFLIENGESINSLNVFASRRGNWQVMMRAAFYNKSLVNLLCPSVPIGHTIHQPSGDIMPIWQVAKRYEQEEMPTVLIAGERYGMGSSRDWAAKSLRLLGIRAVLALSFERIHRTNLIGMGILPLVLPPHMGPKQLAIGRACQIELQLLGNEVGIRQPVLVRIHPADQAPFEIETISAVETQLESALLKVGGVMPRILAQSIHSGHQN